VASEGLFSLITVLALARTGNIIQVENPIRINSIQSIIVLKNTNLFLGIFQPKIKPTQNKIATRIVPELKGIPKLLTVKISVLAKNIVKGNSSLKINSNTETTTTLAIMKFLTVTTL
jgi:hypothetical protein